MNMNESEFTKDYLNLKIISFIIYLFIIPSIYADILGSDYMDHITQIILHSLSICAKDIGLDTKYFADLVSGTIVNKLIHYETKGKRDFEMNQTDSE